MSVPGSQTEIVNMALMQLRIPPITEYNTDTSTEANAARTIFDQRRRAVLRPYIFNFSKAQAIIKKIVNETPTFGYECFYEVPADCLKVMEVGDNDTVFVDKRDWDLQGRRLLMPDVGAECPITYIKDVTDFTLWDPLAIDVLVLELAIWLCKPLTGDASLKDDLKSEQSVALTDALAADFAEAPLQSIDGSYSQAARDLLPSPQYRIDESVFDG